MHITNLMAHRHLAKNRQKTDVPGEYLFQKFEGIRTEKKEIHCNSS